MIKNESEKINVDADVDKAEREYLKQEQDYERKQRQREYMKEKERLQNERFERLEQKVDEIAGYFATLADAEKKKQQKEREEYQNSFEYQINMAHQERLREEERKRYDVRYQADLHYHLFCAWCNAFHPVIVPGTNGKLDIKKMQETSYINTQFFKEYLDEIKTFGSKVSDDTLKRIIAETYFGFEYYKDENGVMKARKKKVENNDKSK